MVFVMRRLLDRSLVQSQLLLPLRRLVEGDLILRLHPNPDLLGRVHRVIVLHVRQSLRICSLVAELVEMIVRLNLCPSAILRLFAKMNVGAPPHHVSQLGFLRVLGVGHRLLQVQGSWELLALSRLALRLHVTDLVMVLLEQRLAAVRARHLLLEPRQVLVPDRDVLQVLHGLLVVRAVDAARWKALYREELEAPLTLPLPLFDASALAALLAALALASRLGVLLNIFLGHIYVYIYIYIEREG